VVPGNRGETESPWAVILPGRPNHHLEPENKGAGINHMMLYVEVSDCGSGGNPIPTEYPAFRAINRSTNRIEIAKPTRR